ncbi:hypothetical protein SAMN06297387_102136 [Streptomyces zhaozhouensis]|uniref:DUF7919 domain-containing protein n=1 Tax=Streptomyces zhaozhouensis TaxID=1300267 RepID=A0A286DP38_9ACTN|nr:hypothetical protein [Streptomyces zhaozhouensis]SOD60455.1 hypothetical protein SAMN06297387_102136 [Streptomyces zhaozhouensis]
MTYYADLSRYTRHPAGVPSGVTALNVGWLSWTRRYPRFARGRVPEEFAAALTLLCRDGQRERTSRFHPCGLPHLVGERRRPVRMRVAGEDVLLGNSEVVAVAADGTWLVAPSLIHHYVTRHRYRPPEEFVEAVLAARTPRAESAAVTAGSPR